MLRRWLWEIARRLRTGGVAAAAACLLVSPALSAVVHPYQRQPVTRVTDALLRQILIEMDLSLRDLTPVVNSTVTGSGSTGYGGSFSDAAFEVYDSARPGAKLMFDLSGLTNYTTRTITWPDVNGTPGILSNPQTWIRTQTFTPDRDENAVTITGVGSGLSSQNLLMVTATDGTDIFRVSGGGAVQMNNFKVVNGVVGTDPGATFGAALISAERDIAIQDVTGTMTVASGASIVTARVPFYGTVTSGSGLLTSSANMTFSVDSLTVAGRVRAGTSIRVGSGQTIAALNFGNWTGTRSAESNLDGTVTVAAGQWMRVGNVVTVSGRFTADATAAGAASFEMSLPIASNFGAAEDAAGTAVTGAIAGGEAVAITASAANDTMVFSWIATDINSRTWSFHATYEVL